MRSLFSALGAALLSVVKRKAVMVTVVGTVSTAAGVALSPEVADTVATAISAVASLVPAGAL